MKPLYGIVIAAGALLIGVWYFRKRAQTSPLAKHYKELEDRAAIGSVSNAVSFMSQPPTAMMGEGTLTMTRANITNPNPVYNKPGTVRFGYRYPQPK